jgi:glycosyltransferase involved in cell wall biosynthesis
MDFDVVLIGRKLSNSLAINRNYKTVRMKLLFNNGFMFYAEYSIRLFFKLFFIKKDVLLSNDLDTLLPNFLISRIFSKKLVYDSHELFTEVPELIDRPTIKNTWLSIEKFIFPRLKNVYTVNASIASIYKKKYNVDVEIIRNIAPLFENESLDIALSKKVKGNKKMLILQGSGINMDRGAEEAVTMMQYLENVVLYVIGSGDVFDKLKELVKTLKLEDKVFIKNRMSYQELMEYTKIADLGLSLDKGTNLNYEYSLPNKVFDYIQAKTPLLVSNRKEIASLVLDNNIGLVVENLDPEKLAQVIKNIFIDQELLKEWRENLVKAQKRYNWEKESIKLKNIFNNL